MNQQRSAVVNDTFDPLSKEFADDPYPVYAKLRDAAHLQYFPAYDMWLVPWHREVSDILTNPRMVRTLDQQLSEAEIAERQIADNWHDMPYHSRFVQFSLLDSDGATHDRLRSLVARFFSPGPIKRIRASVQSFVNQRLDRVTNQGTIDFVEDFAAAIPGHVIGSLMGVPDEDCGQLRVWSERIVQYFDIDRTAERKQLAERTSEEFYRYLCDLRALRLEAPRDDLLSHLVAMEAAGQMSEDEFISTCMLIVMAGHGSTLDVLGSGLHTLLRFPDQARRLRDQPSLISTAVQEMFRFESPLPFFHRYTTEDVELRGQAFATGTRFGLLYGSANRDPAVFEEPDAFDIGRRPNRHRAFGGGAHFCLGNHLARLNMEIVFTSLLQRFSTIELESEPEYKRGLSVRGPKALHVHLTPQSRASNRHGASNQ